MPDKVNVTVAISAYNEEANISFLIKDLLKQEQKDYFLEKIIVVSDGSTDKTVSLVKQFKDKRIHLIKGKQRQGLAYRQNQLFKISTSDILVLIQADLKISDHLFIYKLITPIHKRNKDLASVNVEELMPNNFFEKSLWVSMKLKKAVFDKYHKGDNIYTCYGQARAFSKRLYKNIKYTNSIGEDAYTYLYCKFNNFNYTHVKKATIYYKLPDNLSDHQKQSQRFNQSKRKFIKEFGNNFVKQNYYLPRGYFFTEFVNLSFQYPLNLLHYFLTMCAIKVFSLINNKVSEKWEIAKTSKFIRLNL